MQALNTNWRPWIVLVVMALTPLLRGQAGDFDLEIRVDRDGSYRADDTERPHREWFPGQLEPRAGHSAFATTRPFYVQRRSP